LVGWLVANNARPGIPGMVWLIPGKSRGNYNIQHYCSFTASFGFLVEWLNGRMVVESLICRANLYLLQVCRLVKVTRNQ